MNSLKKALFVACVGLGLGFSISAYAYPSYENCLALQEACLNGSTGSCRSFNANCGVYGF